MKKVITTILFLLIALSATLLYGCSDDNLKEAAVENPHSAEWIDDEMAKSLDSIERVDENGVLYRMDYTSDYYSDTVKAIAQSAIDRLSSGCSAFSTYNTENEFLLCRNYDYLHKDANGDLTGLNVVVYCAPEGKLKSIGVCDAYWLNTSEYYAGALDDGKTDISAMVLAPYMCVDGMNEAGLSASLLVVDLKDGETHINQNTGKERAMQSVLLRYIIDNAHNVDEAVKLAESYDVYSTSVSDLHIYVTDKSGVSAVLEWRQYGDDDAHKLYVTYTNAVTNFYVGFDDAEDSYRADGTLRENFSGFENTFNNYKYGYGHGYHRFNQIVCALERFIASDANEKGIRNSVMEESQALDILRVVSQNPDTENTSFTQYSAIYNLEKLSVSFYMQRDYEKVYTFELK